MGSNADDEARRILDMQDSVGVLSSMILDNQRVKEEASGLNEELRDMRVVVVRLRKEKDATLDSLNKSVIGTIEHFAKSVLENVENVEITRIQIAEHVKGALRMAGKMNEGRSPNH